MVKKVDNFPYFLVVKYKEQFLKNKVWEILFSRLLEIVEMLLILSVLLVFIYKREQWQKKLIRLKRIAEKANEAKDSILASIAHDIKNYIFGIHGLTRIILDSKARSEISASDDLQMVETISDQSEDLMEFVKDLLDKNQLQTGEFSLGRIKECEVKSLVDDVIMVNKSLAERHKIKLKIDVEKALPSLRCDARRIKQVLTNLTNNAIKYSPKESVVTITAKHLQKDNKIYIEIADQGFGMNEQELIKYLSGKDGEIDKSEIGKHKKIDSHGIGMPIVLRLVELHGGKIEVDSKKGKGTKVGLYFNVIEESTDHKSKSKELTQEEKKLSLRKPKQNKSILSVEDNPVNIKIISRLLGSEGYQVTHAENGKEALEILDQKHFDLILMDGEMSVMNGYTATKIIREGAVFKNFKNYKTIPIIALMSSSDEKTIKKALNSGMNNCMEKSVSKTKLLDMIEGYFKG